jgi:hypothetical protein
VRRALEHRVNIAAADPARLANIGLPGNHLRRIRSERVVEVNGRGTQLVGDRGCGGGGNGLGSSLAGDQRQRLPDVPDLAACQQWLVPLHDSKAPIRDVLGSEDRHHARHGASRIEVERHAARRRT